MKGYGIEVKNNLLDPKHVKGMGSAIWEYMWLLDHITMIDDEEIGHIFGGAPIKLAAIQKDLGLTQANISNNLKKLRETGYINVIRTPYGLKISVNKAHKRFTKNDKSNLSKTINLTKENDKSNLSKTINLTKENDKSNKTIQQ